MTPSSDPSAGPDVAAPTPTILFDGVCNLCNASVQWVIERDPEGVFTLAALQSEAARSLLSASGISPERLPDSIVLVDEDGVHVRSEAALRIGRRLGFPYNLVALGRVAPRPLRDAAYRFIARNRYRWFGRRDTCMMPDSDVASRFLDADEPRDTAQPAPPAPTPGPANPPQARTSLLGATSTRFAIAYVFLYMAPFPLTLLTYAARIPWIGDVPGVEAVFTWIAGLHGRLMVPLVGWVGASVFGVAVDPSPTGSGDRAFHYVDLVVDLALALAVALAWTLWSRRRTVSATTWDVSRVLARYYLATTLLVYGWIKVFPLQFALPGPDRLIQSYGDSSLMGLAWTFLGASTGYQIFSGLSELLAGYLLFWRRTTLLGSLFAAAVLTNVVAINLFFDVPVKLFSIHLLVVAFFLMAPDLPRLVGLFGFNLPVHPSGVVPFWRRAAGRQGWTTALHLAFVASLTAMHVSDNLGMSRTRGILAPAHPLAGVYRVESFQRQGRQGTDLPDRERWVRVGITPPLGVATVQWASGDAVRMRLALDTAAATVSFYDRGGQPPPAPDFTFRQDGELLLLEGTWEGEPTVISMRKQASAALLRERGFRWVNEYPFNR